MIQMKRRLTIGVLASATLTVAFAWHPVSTGIAPTLIGYWTLAAQSAFGCGVIGLAALCLPNSIEKE